jgi:hypothetical protein
MASFAAIAVARGLTGFVERTYVNIPWITQELRLPAFKYHSGPIRVRGREHAT